MANFTIVDDINLELAVLIDTDTFVPLPLVAAGPDRVNLLQAFSDSVPFELTMLPHDTLRAVFAQFLGAVGAVESPTTGDTDTDTVGPDARDRDNDQASLAEHESANATDTPAEQPADADVEQDARTQTVRVRCWNCNGTGQVEFGNDEPPVTCNICKGTGAVEQQVVA